MVIECDAILFDLDGVLIDSTSCVERHWRDWAGLRGLDAEAILRIAHGVRNIETMRAVAPLLDVEQEAALFAAGEVADTQGVLAVEGAGELLAGLGDARWGIVTSCSAALARARLAAARLVAPAVLITGDDVLHGKPAPDPYRLGAERLAVEAASCVVIEDAPAGITAGKTAGMRVIGIAFTFPPQDLLAAGAEVVITDLGSLAVEKTATQLRLTVRAG